MSKLSFAQLFKSQDSKYTLQTAALVTAVPLAMLSLIVYSVWLLVVVNHSYFISNGFPLADESKEEFMLFLLSSQLDYLPYVGLFFILVFFIGLFIAYIVLRPFNQVVEMCENSPEQSLRSYGLNNKKAMVKLGRFICEYRLAQQKNTTITLPVEIEKAKGPMLDMIFYFQFFLLIGTLITFTVTSIYFFTLQLHESIVSAAVSTLKASQGMRIFLASQSDVLEVTLIIVAVFTIILYLVISRLIISKIEGVTYGYLRDVRDVVNGQYSKRLHPRSEDPGIQASVAINKLLDQIHPRV